MSYAFIIDVLYLSKALSLSVQHPGRRPIPVCRRQRLLLPQRPCPLRAPLDDQK